MATDLKTYSCDYCGNFHDPSYSDCATGEPYTKSAAPPAVLSTDGIDALAEDYARHLRLRVRMETSLERRTVEAVVKYATETFVDTLRNASIEKWAE